ncbi:hypothetical protein [uncultured Thiohalocapsa sp.]|uniref:hypothetical protein n=1 Tax=uncultured Thiohalocapsa sp. TaxID=768990 RepID=UPI0025F53E2B|nr:hypothetical protein [uncultured Thiohalocapsa sp.]
MSLGIRARLQGWQQRRESKRRLAEAAERIGGSALSGVIDQPDRLFDAAFRLNAWQGRESRSGRGADLDNTEALRSALPPMIHERYLGENERWRDKHLGLWSTASLPWRDHQGRCCP